MRDFAVSDSNAEKRWDDLALDAAAAGKRLKPILWREELEEARAHGKFRDNVINKLKLPGTWVTDCDILAWALERGVRVVISQRTKVAESGKPPPSRGACTSHMVGTDEERAAFGYPPLGDRVLQGLLPRGLRG